MVFSRNSGGFTRDDVACPRPSSESRFHASAKRAMTAITTAKAFVKKVSSSQTPPPPSFNILRVATTRKPLSTQSRRSSAAVIANFPECPRPSTSGTAMSIPNATSIPGLCVTHPTTKNKGKPLIIHTVSDLPLSLGTNKTKILSPRFPHPINPDVLDAASPAGSRCSTPATPKSWRTVESDSVLPDVHQKPLSPKAKFRNSEASFAEFVAQMDKVPGFSPRERVPIPEVAPQIPEVRKMSRFNVLLDVADDKPLPPPPASPSAFPRGHPTVLKPKANRQSLPPQASTTAQTKAPRPWSCAPSTRPGTKDPLIPYMPYKQDFDPYRASPPSPNPNTNAPEVVPQQKTKPVVKRKPAPTPAAPKPAAPKPAAPPKPAKPSRNFKMNDSGFPVHSRSSATKFTTTPAYQPRTQDLVEKKFRRDEAAKVARVAERQQRAMQAHYAAMNAGRRRYMYAD